MWDIYTHTTQGGGIVIRAVNWINLAKSLFCLFLINVAILLTFLIHNIDRCNVHFGPETNNTNLIIIIDNDKKWLITKQT